MCVLVVAHPRFIYPFQADDSVLPGFKRVSLEGSDGVQVFGQERSGEGPVLLYFMGNAGAVPFFASGFERHIAADRHIIALEYRGGGGRPGTPSETILKRDALTVADYALTKSKPVIVQGFSLGTGLALHVSARRSVERVVLTAPYDRLCRVMAARTGLPVCLLPFVQKWPAFEDFENVTVPRLVLHGAADDLIPPARSAAFVGPNITRLIIPDAGHNDIGSYPAYGAAIDAFLGTDRTDYWSP